MRSLIQSLCLICLLASANAAVQQINQDMCSGPKSVVHTVEVGQQYLLTVDSNCEPPKVTEQFTVGFVAAKDVLVYIQYIHTYFTGNATYWNATAPLETSTLIESSNEVASFKKFNLKAIQPLKIIYDPPANDTLWTGIQALFLFIDPSEKNCPQAVTFNDTTYIVSDNDVTEITAPSANSTSPNTLCRWTVPISVSGSLVVKILHFQLNTQEENLTISGILNNSPKIVSIKNTDSQYFHDLQYFDGPINMELYRNPGQISNEVPQVRILINPVLQVLKSCTSLQSLHNNVFTNTTGTFTNIRQYKPYAVSEKCSWAVEVPKSKYLIVKPHRQYVGWFSGDTLAFKTTEGSEIVRIEKDRTGLMRENYSSMKMNETTNVTFTWETDSFYEYNGFELEYQISDNDGTNESATLRQSHLITLLCAVVVCLLSRML